MKLTEYKGVVFSLVAVIALSLGALLLVAGQGETHSTRFPGSTIKSTLIVTWMPNTLTATVAPGDTRTFPVSLAFSKNVERVTFEVSSSLGAFVSVQPQALDDIRKGEIQTLNIICSSSPSAPLGTITGMIWWRKAEGKENKRTDDDDESDGEVSLPLRVSLNIWPKSTLPGSGVQVNYPPSFVPVSAEASSTESVGFYDSPQTYSQGLPPRFSVAVTALPQGISLMGWVRSFGIPDSDTRVVNIGGQEYLEWFESIGDSMGTTSFSRLLDFQQVVTVTTADPSFASSTYLTQIISSLEPQ